MNQIAKERIDNKALKKELFFLILSCSGGAGHIRAAEALHKTAVLTGLPIRIEHYDVLDLTSKLFKRLYSQSYLQMVNHAPELWGYLYQQSERNPFKKNAIVKLFDELNYKGYLNTIKTLKPDALICTHFLPYISITKHLQANDNSIPVFAVTTDFDVHQLWIDQIVRKYFVFHEESAWQLQSKNIQQDKIIITGIPVMPDFQKKENKSIVRKEIGIGNNYFTLLILSGGFGVGRIKEIVEHTSQTLILFPARKFNLLIVCGKNENAKQEIERLQFPPNVSPYIFGFVSNIHKLMDASNILISKAGGLTTSEALAKSLPVIIIDPIPGQESRNTDLIVEHGAGWKAINLANLSYKLKKILEQPSIIKDAQKAAKKLAKPNAASTILNYIYKDLTKNSEN